MFAIAFTTQLLDGQWAYTGLLGETGHPSRAGNIGYVGTPWGKDDFGESDEVNLFLETLASEIQD